MTLFTKKTMYTFLICITCSIYANATLSDALKIRIVNGTYSDETVVRFLSAATPGFDADYDAYKIISAAPGIPSAFTNIDPLSHLSINGLPALTERTDVDLYTYIKTAGNYTFQSIELGSFSAGSRIVLEDKQTGLLYSFRDGSSTVIYLNANLVTAASRFTLHFIPVQPPPVSNARYTTLGSFMTVDSLTDNNINVTRMDGIAAETETPQLKAYPQDGELVLDLQTTAVSDILITVYNISGQVIYRYSNKSSMGVSERLPLTASGMYIVQTMIDNNVQTKKINYTK
ncbi:MAG: large protein [Bacteroidetes bacterium]|nr:large protein [Bacteroidota bacterium]